MGLVETSWLKAVVRLRSKIYSGCRCDDTNNVAPRDIGLETSSTSLELDDYDHAVHRNASKSLWGKKLGG